MEPSKTKPIRVLIVVINYFSHELVSNLLKGLARQKSEHPIQISVVCSDNSATSKEHEALNKIQAESELELELLFQSHNLGFGRAINAATKGRHFDFLWLLNPDVDLFPDTLNELIKPSLELKSGVVGGLTLTKNHQPDYRHAWREPNLLNTIGWAFGIKQISSSPLWHDSYRHDNFNNTSPYKVDNISGCCMLISHETWQATEGFDEDFFLYSEEIDLCRRARTLGYQPFTAPSARLHHSLASSDTWITKIPLIYASKLIYATKHNDLPYRISYRVIIGSGALLRCIVGLFQGKKDRMAVWWNVALSALSLKSCTLENKT